MLLPHSVFMSVPKPVPPALLNVPFRSARAHAAGLGPEQLRGARFTRLFRDVYVSAGLPLTHDLRCRGAALVLPAGAVFCGLTAARLYGVPVPDRDDRLHVAVPTENVTAPRREGFAVHRCALPREQTRVHQGLPVTSPERTFIDLSATLDRVDRVILGDALLARGLTSPEAVAKIARASRGRRGVRRAVDALPLLEPGADSPMETRVRLIIVDAGLPRPLANVNVRDDWGEWIARPDLLYRRARIIIEYEGGHHRTDARQFSRDLARGDILAQHGYLVLRFEARHVFREPHRIVDAVATALRRRGYAA